MDSPARRGGVACNARCGREGVPAYSHPLHTTLTEITMAPDGSVQIVLRAFVDDFSAAVTGRRIAAGEQRFPRQRTRRAPGICGRPSC